MTVDLNAKSVLAAAVLAGAAMAAGADAAYRMGVLAGARVVGDALGADIAHHGVGYWEFRGPDGLAGSGDTPESAVEHWRTGGTAPSVWD